MVLARFCLALLFLLPGAALDGAEFQRVIFGRYSPTLEAFESFAQRAKQSGATHIVITAEDLPWAMWQMDTPGDPYPAWAVSNVGLLKVSIPKALQPYLPKDYSDKTMGILSNRCQVLRKLNLKAAFTTFEPQILPERVYEAHPLWRGPQVDHPLRSRVPRFAPSIDHPEVLAMYRESIGNLLKVCPEIEILSLHTNDSGSGMSWSPGVYQGANGSILHRERKMYERYRNFFGALQQGAADARPGPLEIDAEWVREQTPELVATKLGPGMAVANFEGPGATRYKAVVGFLLDYFYPFYPAQGLPLPVRYLEELEAAVSSGAPRLFYLLGDKHDTDLYLQIYDAFRKTPTKGDASRMQLLRTIAASRVGDANAESLLGVWTALHRTQRDADILNFGGTLFYIAAVHQRWLTRPFVPFPQELPEADTRYYRQFQFQARGEDRARDLGDIQGTRQYEGLGGTAVSGQLLMRMQADLERAQERLRAMAASPAVARNKEALELMDKRVQVLRILVDNSRNGLEYQYQLDFARDGRLRRPIEFQEHLTDITEWNWLKRIARHEMDNSTMLADLLEANPNHVLIDTADDNREESIRVLGKDLPAQLRRKVQLMVRHWEDYERLFDEEMKPPAPNKP
jgi:hypothetical protein